MKRYILIFMILLAAGSLLAQTPTVSDLSPNGGGIKWYSLSSGGTLYTGSEALVSGQHYYASQTANNVESTARLDVTATVNPLPTPTFTAQPGATANTATDVTYTTESGKTNYVWTYPGTLTTDYTITSGGTSTDYTVTLKYVTTGSKTVTVNYTANGCTAASATSSTATMVSTLLAIGVAYQGGKIAYIDGTGLHGLIAATADQSSGIEWITGGLTEATANNNTSTAYGTGQANTTAMMNQTDYTGGAAKVCNDYINTDTGTGVYSDWYLPSLNELSKLYDSRVAIGAFDANWYWSSSECTLGSFIPYNANSWSFSDGSTMYYMKSNTFHVRAVRTF